MKPYLSIRRVWLGFLQTNSMVTWTGRLASNVREERNVTKLTAALPLRIIPRDEIEAPDADARLVERFLRGDARAFELLFRKHQSYAFNVAYGLVGNSEDAADITQEAFLRVHRNMGRFRGDSTFTTWLYRVVVNLAITELRRRTRSRTVLMEDIAPAEAWRAEEEADAPVLHLEIDEERETVQRVLRHLPPDYRAVLVLRHFQQLAYEEICQVLGLTMSQVKTRLHRARRMFKERYQAFSEAPDAL
jgi:RNA polymerase sigma-70 factor, ECF subfamily